MFWQERTMQFLPLVIRRSVAAVCLLAVQSGAAWLNVVFLKILEVERLLGVGRVLLRLPLQTGAAVSAGAAIVGPIVPPAAEEIPGLQVVETLEVEAVVEEAEVVGVEEEVEGRRRVIPTIGVGGVAGRAVIRAAAAMSP